MDNTSSGSIDLIEDVLLSDDAIGRIQDDIPPDGSFESTSNAELPQEDVIELIESFNDDDTFDFAVYRSCSDQLFHLDYKDSTFRERHANNSVMASTLARIPDSALWNKINTLFPHKPNMTSLEFWIIRFMVDWSIRHYAASRDSRQIQMWDDVRATLYGSLELIQLGMYAFLGMMLLSNHNCHYLLGDVPVDDGLELSIAKVYHFSMHLYDYLLKATSEQMTRVLNNTCTSTEAKILVTSLSFLFAILGSLPPGTCPLIDFTRAGNDFIAYNIGYRQTHTALLPLLRNLPFENKHGLNPLVDDCAMTLPFFARILEYIDANGNELGTGATVIMVRHAFNVFNHQIYCTSVTFNPLGYYHIFVKVTDEFWELVYSQNRLALSWLNVLAAYALVFKLYFIRDRNIWVEYMNWYRAWYGHSYFWDEPLYQVVVEQGYVVHDYALLQLFNPLELVTTAVSNDVISEPTFDLTNG